VPATFSRTMRSLDADSLRTSILGLLLAAVLCGLWAAWFFFAQVTLYEVSETVRVVADAGAVAQFPPAALVRVRPGQRARLHLDGFPSTQYRTVPATVVDVTSEIRDGQVEIELVLHSDPASVIPLQQGLTGMVEIEIGRVSPATLVLHSAGEILTNLGALPRPSDVRGANR
jgi:hypothetical protein